MQRRRGAIGSSRYNGALRGRAVTPGDAREGACGMNKWEYKIINIRSENYRLDPNAAPQLNLLGDEGWELVSITSVNFKTGATDNIAMVFKRPHQA
jgi:selenocysteine lyase/cysteine desulfurase